MIISKQILNSKIKIILIIGVLTISCFIVYYLIPKESNSNMQNTIEQQKSEIIREPAVAGQFYPEDKQELKQAINDFLKKIKTQEKTPQILIVPHAGYVFSGQITAYAFKQVQNKKFNKVILLGNSHQEQFSGLSLDNSDVWKTPLGQVKLDKETIKNLTQASKLIHTNSEIHLDEHSLEVEVPFLQQTLEKDFKLIPGLFGSDNNLDNLKDIAQTLAKIIDEQTLVVISTDLSHYPNYEDAKTIDSKTIQAILNQDAEKFLNITQELQTQQIENLSTYACAWPAVATAILLSNELNLKAELLAYTNSGDVPEIGDKNRVVGYNSIAFYKNIKIQEHKNMNELNQNEQQIALKLARQTLENSFDASKTIAEDYQNYAIFNEKRGVFVTLHKDEELRGCIGLIEPSEIPLSQTIQQMALSSAFNDTRFPPLTVDELDQVKIEISVLSVPQKSSTDKVELGKHGVIIKSGFNSGVFLPQVAEETDWTKEQFLSELCSQKAGLSANCWRDTNVELYTFEAQVFSE